MLSIIYWSLKLTSVNDLILESSCELAFSDERHMMADFSYRSSIFAIVTPIFEKISFDDSNWSNLTFLRFLSLL